MKNAGLFGIRSGTSDFVRNRTESLRLWDPDANASGPRTEASDGLGASFAFGMPIYLRTMMDVRWIAHNF